VLNSARATSPGIRLLQPEEADDEPGEELRLLAEMSQFKLSVAADRDVQEHAYPSWLHDTPVDKANWWRRQKSSVDMTESALHNSVFTYTTCNVLGLCKRLVRCILLIWLTRARF
jgi:hypothetical protein